MKNQPKVALVCDWLTSVGGGEKVLLAFHEIYKDAPIYTSKYLPKKIDWFKDADVRTGWIKIFPACLRRFIGPLRQFWFKHLNLSEYDIVISVTGAEAKFVRAKNGIHVCYCHVPTQYYWGMYDDYIKNPGFGILNPIVRFFFKLMVGPLRKADFKAAAKPDYYLTISKHAQAQIKKYYHRDSVIIAPGVEVDTFQEAFSEKPRVEDYLIVTSRQVNWKRLDIAIEACKKTNQRLLVIGTGPEHRKLVKLAGGSENIKFLPTMKKRKLAKYLASAKGYLFTSLEPFGIAPVEALAAGCPVIAFGEGGALDYVQDGKNGLLFKKQTADSLAAAIRKFEDMKFNRAAISRSAEPFARERFDRDAAKFVEDAAKAGKKS